MQTELRTLVVAAALAASSVSFAQERELSPVIAGAFDVGFRYRDTSGNEDKYFEHLNYRSGPRLFNLDLELSMPESDVLDLVSVYGSGLGGDPYQVSGVTVKKFGSYTFRYQRRVNDYFYRDTILPKEQASIEASSGGDFHTFDFTRANDTLHFDFDVDPSLNVFVDFNRQERRGESTTTLDISRDEFELDAPIRQTKNDYTVGVQKVFEHWTLYFDQSFRQYRSDGRIFLPGASPGENPDDETVLFFFEQLLPQEFDTPQSTLTASFRPRADVNVTASVLVSALDGEFDYSEEDRGIAFTGAPFDRLATGRGRLDASTTLVDVDAVYAWTHSVSVIGGIRSSRYDQTTSLETELVELVPPGQSAEPALETGVDIASDILEAGARVSPRSNLQITGGLRFESRDVTTRVALDEHVAPATERTSAFVDASFSPHAEWDLLAEYEIGDYDNPFTRVSPSGLDRFKARVRYTSRSVPGLGVVGTVLTRRLSNAVTDYSLAADHYSLHARYAADRVTAYGGYIRQRWDSAIVNEVMTAPGFLGGQSFTHESFYDSTLDMVSGGVGYNVAEWLRAGADVTVYDNEGSFGQQFRQFKIFADVPSPAGYVVRLMYWRNHYDESDFDFDDYRSNIVTVSIGYRF